MKQQKERKKKPGVSDINILTLLSILVSIILVWGCAGKPINPQTLKVKAADKIRTEFPPSDDDLIIRSQLLLPLVVYKDQTATKQRLMQILGFLHQGFEQNGNIAAIPQSEVAELLSREENRRFQVTNVADAIQLGKSLKAKFVSQMQITIIESKTVKGVDQFKAKIQIAVFKTNTGEAGFQKDIIFDSQDYEESEADLKLLIQSHFPLVGYILETRGDRQVAKISLGRSLGIKLNREFHIRERIVKSEIVSGDVRKMTSFSPKALATAKVIMVMENESWIAIEKEDRIKIKSGQVVFSLPEKKGLFF